MEKNNIAVLRYIGLMVLILASVGLFFGLTTAKRSTAGEVEAATSGDWTYTVASDKATITAYSGTATDLTIPSTLDGYTVTQIGASSATATFLTNARTTLTKVTIPTSVTVIGQCAFRQCTALTTVAYADGMGAENLSFGASSFSLCTALTSFTFPDGAKTLGLQANVFGACSNLTDVTFPCKNYDVNTSYIGINGGGLQFNQCNSLVRFHITTPASGVRPRYGVDESGAFYTLRYENNQPLYDQLIFVPYGYTGDANNSFTLPASVKSIGGYGFAFKVKSVKIPTDTQLDLSKFTSKPDFYTGTIESFDMTGSGQTNWYTTNGVLYYNDNGTRTLVCCPNKNTTGAFIVPSNVNIINHIAFEGCLMSSITINEGCTTLGNHVFWKCSRLTSVSLPSTLQSIGFRCFTQSPITTLTIPASNPYLKTDGLAIYTKDNKKLLAVLCKFSGTLNILEGTEELEEDCCYNNNGTFDITGIIIPASVKTINYRAFNNCNKITNITFNHTSIPDDFLMGNATFIGANSSLQVNLQNRQVYNYFKSNFTTSQFTNAPTCFKCLDYTVTLTLDNMGSTSNLYSWGSDSGYSMYSDANHTTAVTSLSSVPTRDGYVFDGYWLDDGATSTQYITKTGAFTNNIANIDADSTLYAHWLPNQPLLWSTMGGAARINGTDRATGLVHAEVTETYSGYTFSGWSTSDGTDISAYTVSGSTPLKAVDIPASVLNGKILIASFKQGNAVVDNLPGTIHNFFMASTEGGYARVLGDTATATSVRTPITPKFPTARFSSPTIQMTPKLMPRSATKTAC